jgi:hypothetical protein
MLRSLESDGLIVGEHQPDLERGLRIFHTTNDGARSWCRWIHSPISESSAFRPEVVARLASLRAAEAHHRPSLIEKELESRRRRVRALDRKRCESASIAGADDLARLAISGAINAESAVINWLTAELADMSYAASQRTGR